jgi:hypothetical protein
MNPSFLLVFPALAQQPGEEVKLPLDRFLDLYEASRNPRPPEAPREFALASANYDGEVVLEDGEPVAALLTATFNVANLRKPGYWIRVPLLPADVAVRKATLGNTEAPLVLENGWYTLVTDRPGTSVVTVELAVAVGTTEGTSGFQFPLAESGATTVELAVPSSDALDFTIANAKLSADATEGGRRVVRGTLPSTGSLAVRWQREIPEAQKQAARVYSEVHTLVGVGDGLLSARVTVRDAILFSGIDQVKLQVPKEMTVLSVEGTGLRDWRVDGEGLLTADLNFDATGSYAMVLELERVLPEDAAIQVPVVQQLGVERAKGFVGIQSLGNLELTPGAVQGAAAVDVRTLPSDITGVTGVPVLLGYKYLGGTATIPLDVRDHEEVDVLVTLLDQASATTAFTRDGRRLTNVAWQVRNNRRQFLRLALPAGAELWSASVAGRAVQPAKSEDGSLLVPLVRSSAAGGALAAFDVQVTYVEEGTPEAGRFQAELPTADAPTTWVGWTVLAPKGSKMPKKVKEGSLRKVDWLTPPPPAAQVYQQMEYNQAVGNQAFAQSQAGGLGEGAAPVQVTLPTDGVPLYFEKLLVLDEKLWVGFDYKEPKK